MKLPQLSLRELFLLVVIAALGCGWWMDHHDLVASYNALKEFYETPIQFDAPIEPVEPDPVVSARSVSEPLIMESEFHEWRIEGQPIQ